MASEDQSSMNGEKEDVFMKIFKKFKRRKPPPDLSDVLNFHQLPIDFNENVTIKRVEAEINGYCQGVIPTRSWDIYEFRKFPGIFYIKNPFLPYFRKYWVSRCLLDFPNKPHVCNLDGLQTGRDDENIWMSATKTEASTDAKKQLHKLRWVTLGYHYDWTKKIYCRDICHRFPADLGALCKLIAEVIGYREYRSEAAIVNYYHLDSSFSGHTDHSEFDLQAPLISISFGLSCVFMVGGTTKDVTPQAMFLHDGDIVIMSNHARLSYHAVPKVLPSDLVSSERLTKAELNTSNYMNSKSISTVCNSQTSSKSSSKADMENSSGSHNASEKEASISGSCDCLSTTYEERTDSSESPEPKRVKHNCGNVSNESIFCESTLCKETIDNVMKDDYWKPFKDYLVNSRINMNIRQVFEPGKGPDDYVWPLSDPQENQIPNS